MALETFTKESKNIAKTVYNNETKDLFVTFKSFKDPKITTEYVYSGVPAETWEELKKAESVGKFINERIKNIYSFKKL